MAAIMRQKRKQILTITRLIGALALVAGLGVAVPVQAAGLVESIVTDPLTGVALEGYDPVSYFIGPEPVMGTPDFAYEWGGVPWYFASPANRDVFIRNPEIYVPQYGGHCLTSLSRGFLSDGKPRLYAIKDMKLYLFYSVANREAFFASGDSIVPTADTQWTKLRPGLAGAGDNVVEGLEPAADQSSH
jgi:YHS domain-containing protein